MKYHIFGTFSYVHSLKGPIKEITFLFPTSPNESMNSHKPIISLTFYGHKLVSEFIWLIRGNGFFKVANAIQ